MKRYGCVNKKYMKYFIQSQNIGKERDNDSFSIINNYNDHNLQKKDICDQNKNMISHG